MTAKNSNCIVLPWEIMRFRKYHWTSNWAHLIGSFETDQEPEQPELKEFELSEFLTNFERFHGHDTGNK